MPSRSTRVAFAAIFVCIAGWSAWSPSQITYVEGTVRHAARVTGSWKDRRLCSTSWPTARLATSSGTSPYSDARGSSKMDGWTPLRSTPLDASRPCRLPNDSPSEGMYAVR